ncbi:unnamed protein product [Darwinula stevensoni]|uniref:Copine-3 n=1 Tax=Darwinula stevensoni TaxID=69355 RepID=A0A7R8X4F9_9CRUS|nr:unnamed protein product [Darwinula stevensoni]CAG0885995.1 unnamed protein product [Darwinula stevensoni]
MDPYSNRGPHSQVELTVSARNLVDQDVVSASDPFCVLSMRKVGSAPYTEVGRTETLKNNRNPSWSKKFILDYFFEERCELKFEIYDRDSSSDVLRKHDFVGVMECSLGEIVACGGRQFTRRLAKAVGSPTLSIVAEEVSSCKEEAQMQFSGTKLDKKDTFGKSDPFLIFSKSNSDGSFSVVHRTEVMSNTLNPKWRPFSLPVQKLCNGDHNRTIKVECFDWDRDGTHDLIGETTTTLKQLAEGPNSSKNRYELINPRKRSKKKYKNSGILVLNLFKLEVKPSFLDYVKGGTQIHFTVAIDFTASNGHPQDPRSLHYRNPNGLNPYAMAIRAVGDIIQDYDSDKQFPALGFGAQIPPMNQVSHEFYLNGHPENPYCSGIDGVLQAYYSALYRVTLHGPTYFAPVIRHVSRFAAASTGQDYFILLIITDGIICDMDATKEALVRASTLPMSVIIVGVGNENFAEMERLDADDRGLVANGVPAQRDIVQFVALNKYIDQRMNRAQSYNQSALARDVLAEVPNQLLSYMKMKGIPPPDPSSSPMNRYMGLDMEQQRVNLAADVLREIPNQLTGHMGLNPPSLGHPLQSDAPLHPGSSASMYSPHHSSPSPGYPPHSSSPIPGYPPNPSLATPGYPPNPSSSAPGYTINPQPAAPGYSPNPSSYAPGYLPQATPAPSGYVPQPSHVYPPHPDNPSGLSCPASGFLPSAPASSFNQQSPVPSYPSNPAYVPNPIQPGYPPGSSNSSYPSNPLTSGHMGYPSNHGSPYSH